MTKNKEVETAMMCWEAVNDFSNKEPRKGSMNKEEKPIEKTEKSKHEEEHVEPTLNKGNRLKNSIKEFRWGREDDESTLYTQETEQHKLVYITNLKDGLQKDGTKLYDEEGPNNIMPAAENRLFEKPTLNNLNHVYELYEESGSDNENLEDFVKGENKKNSKEKGYTNMDEEKEGKQADLLIKEKPRNHHDIPRKKGKNEEALVTKEMALSNLGENIFIGDSAATSHMTSNKLGVYNLVPTNGSVMIGNGESISCTHKGKLDVICKHKDESMARETWDVKIVPQLNHDLFSFTKAMKEGWQMNERWKGGGLVIELFKTTRASMKFDRMIPSGSSWLMGIYVQRVLDHAHSAMEPGKTMSMSKLYQITGHTGELLLIATANYMRIKLTGKLAPCEVCAQANIRQANILKKKMKKLPTRPGYRVFMDICSFKQVSRGGNRHWLIVVDEFSDCTDSFFLSRKSDQIKIIPMWIKGLSKKYGIEIKRIRLDNVVKIKAYKKNATKKPWGIFLSSQHQEHLSRIQWQKEEYHR